MNVRKVESLETLRKVRNLTLEGKIWEAKNEIFKAKLCPDERDFIMENFTKYIVEYNKSINWDDICHS